MIRGCARFLVSSPVALVLLACSLTNAGTTANAGPEAPPRTEVGLLFTLFDAPFNLGKGFSFPSMRQSLDVAWALDRLTVLGIQEGYAALLPGRVGLRTGLGVGTAAAAAFGLLFVNGWMHEEWHRAVLSSRAVNSRNGFYHAAAWSSGIVSVDHVTDEDLARLKAETPADMVRAMSAGMESEQALVVSGGDELFFHGGQGWRLGPFYGSGSGMAPVLLVTQISTIGYYYWCMDPALDKVIDEQNMRQADWRNRDFTGPDCTAWVRDLFRPDEPYRDRGPHPTGIGIDRYVNWSDLTSEERSYFKRQSRLHLLNLLDPHLYGLDGVTLNQANTDSRWVAALGHFLTPWGYTLDVRAGLRTGAIAGNVVIHNGFAKAGYFPGIELAVVGWRLPTPGSSLDGAVGLWLQPRSLRYAARERVPGGRLQARLSWRVVDRLDLWAQIAAKKEGWVMGEVYLGPMVCAAVGITGHLH